MSNEPIGKFGTSVPMGRAGQPVEVATAFVYLISADSSYIMSVWTPFFLLSYADIDWLH